MPGPLISEVLPDLLEEMVHLLQGTGAEPLGEQLRALRIESVCDCGDENCASFATAAEVKVDSVVELEALEGYLIIDLNPANQICFIEVLGRQDVRKLLDECEYLLDDTVLLAVDRDHVIALIQSYGAFSGATQTPHHEVDILLERACMVAAAVNH